MNSRARLETFVGGTLGSAFRVCDLVEENAVNRELSVVAGDADLGGGVERNFLQTVPICNSINERNDDVEAGGHRLMELPQTLYRPSLLLGNDDKALGGKENCHANQKHAQNINTKHRRIASDRANARSFSKTAFQKDCGQAISNCE